jgi:hypothetical protein
VPDGPLTPDGSTTVTYIPATAPAATSVATAGTTPSTTKGATT